MRKYVMFAAVCGLSSAAQAGGPIETVMEPAPVAAMAPAPDFDWSGFYLGVSVTDGDISGTGGEIGTDGYTLQAGYLSDLGTFVVGSELAYSDSDADGFDEASITSTRLKLIGGFDAGRFMPYGFVGLSEIEISEAGSSISDTTTNYGIGGRFAFGASGNLMAGLEYLVEDKDDFADTTSDIKRDEIALRLDYRF